MRINIYAEEYSERLAIGVLPNIERVTKTADTGITYFGARIYLKSPEEIHARPDDDDRNAITFWGSREKVAKLLRAAADVMEDGQPR